MSDVSILLRIYVWGRVWMKRLRWFPVRYNQIIRQSRKEPFRFFFFSGGRDLIGYHRSSDRFSHFWPKFASCAARRRKPPGFLDRAASRSDRGNVERNKSKRSYSASKVMLTLALTISFADWTTVPASSSIAGSSIPVVREYTFPILFW